MTTRPPPPFPRLKAARELVAHPEGSRSRLASPADAGGLGESAGVGPDSNFLSPAWTTWETQAGPFSSLGLSFLIRNVQIAEKQLVSSYPQILIL